MEGKYLPIGTVCTLKNNNKKYMIVSYFSIEYNNTMTLYDYKGCVYPEGLLLPSQSLSFNHDDINSVDFMGYENEQFKVLNENLNRKRELETEEDHDILNNFKFDENGVVVFDSVENNNNEDIDLIEEDKGQFNPFRIKNEVPDEIDTTTNIFKTPNFDENGVVKGGFAVPRYEFDENGVVIKDNTIPEQPSTPRYEFDENGVVVKDNTVLEQPSAPRYEFDENGVVVKDNTVPEQPSAPRYEFDENGVVVKDNTVSEQPSNSRYEFDENGVVVKDNTVPEQPATPRYEFDENGVVIKDNSLPKKARYEFDDNGVVIKDNTVE